MGIFDRFANKNTNNDLPETEEYKKAYGNYQEGNYQGALGALIWGFKKDVEYIKYYKLAAECLIKLDGADEAKLFQNAIKDMQSFEAFRDLGNYFFEQGNYDLAAPFFKKAVAIDPSHDYTVHDLALVLARRFQIAEAIKVLEENEALNDFWNYWFWCKLRVLAGQPEGIHEGLSQLLAALGQEEDQTQVEVPRQKVNEVVESLSRLNVIGNPNHDIQDWHFIQYGGAILDYFDETDDFVAGGRYVALWGSNESIRGIIQKLITHLNNLNVVIETVHALPDRNSQIVGQTVAQILGVRCEQYSPEVAPEKSIVVGASTSDFDGYQELATITNGQVTFALNHSWLASASITPDILGFMAQTYLFPWEGGAIRIVDSETNETERTEPDNRDTEIIAKEIAEFPISENQNNDRLKFYVNHIDHLKGTGAKSTGNRYNFMIESPVPGSFFG